MNFDFNHDPCEKPELIDHFICWPVGTATLVTLSRQTRKGNPIYKMRRWSRNHC